MCSTQLVKQHVTQQIIDNQTSAHSECITHRAHSNTLTGRFLQHSVMQQVQCLPSHSQMCVLSSGATHSLAAHGETCMCVYIKATAHWLDDVCMLTLLRVRVTALDDAVFTLAGSCRSVSGGPRPCSGSCPSRRGLPR